MTEPDKRGKGRPRSAAARQSILDATLQCLVAEGYEALTMGAVARAAGAGKSTIYRWWPNKVALVTDAFLAATQEELRMPDTGQAAADFRHQITALAAVLRGPTGQAFAAMVAGARHAPEIGGVLGQRWLAPRRAWGQARMARAMAEGECRDGIDPEAALAALYAPVYAPLLFGQPIPDATMVARCLDIVLAGIFRASRLS